MITEVVVGAVFLNRVVNSVARSTHNRSWNLWLSVVVPECYSLVGILWRQYIYKCGEMTSCSRQNVIL